MTGIKYAKIALVTSGVAIVVWLSACVLYSYYVRYEAERCFKVFSQFRTGSTTTKEATKALRPFNRLEEDGTANLYGTEYPVHIYTIKNEGNHLLGLFQPTFFQVSLIGPTDAVLIEKSAGLLQMPFRSVLTSESTVDSQHIQALRDSASGIVVGLFDPPVRMIVRLSPKASDEVHKSAYGYDLACFTTVYGCRTIYEMLPSVNQYIKH